MIQIGQNQIGKNTKPYIIAEMSGNHNQSLERAIRIVEAAAQTGAQALKLQTYTADSITLNVETPDFVIQEKDSLWAGQSLYKLYEQAYTPWEWHEPIIKRANELGMDCFSSPFDETAVDFLENLNVPAYKIASFENNHIPLIRKVAKTGKPIIISTGMASLADIELAVNEVRNAGCKDIILLKCTSTYPALPINTNINTIPHMRQLFDCEVGLSDHTMGVGVAVASVALGCTIIEKHFTLNRADGGVDSAFSLEPDEFKLLVDETERAWQSLGNIHYGYTDAEKKSLMFRRSIYISEDVVAGEILTPLNIKCVRPGFGLPPKMYFEVLGKKFKNNLSKGTPLTWNLLD